MKKGIFLILFVLSCYSANSQNILWAKKMGGIGNEGSISITCDNKGNVYTSGTFTGTADFNPNAGLYNLTSLGFQDIFISKLDANGSFVWAKSYGSKWEDWGCVSIKVNSLGNIAICGYFKDTISFDTKEGQKTFVSSTGIGGYDTFIAILDSNGNMNWVRQFKSFSYPPDNPIAIDEEDNFYLTGNFRTLLDCDPSDSTYYLSPPKGGNAFILKLNANGEFKWAKNFGGYGSAYAASVQGVGIDKMGNVITVGKFGSTNVDFDTGPAVSYLSSHGDYDIFIYKIDSNGNFIGAKSIGGISTDLVKSMKLDDIGNIYMYGTFERTVDFDPSDKTYNITAPNFSTLSFIAKYNSNAEFIWAKKINGNQTINGLGLDGDANIFIAGQLNDSTDLNPNEGDSLFFGKGGFVCKWDSSGIFNWAKRIGYACGYLAVDKFGDVYNTNFFFGNINLDSSSNSFLLINDSDSLDYFVFKIQGCIPLTASGNILGPQSVCIGTQAFYSLNSSYQASNYVWQVPSGSNITNGQNTKNIEVTFGDSSGNILVSQKNTCSSLPPLLYSIQVKSLQAPIVGTNIYPSSSVCAKTPIKINGTGAKWYEITDSVKNGVLFIIDTTKTYTILGTDSNGCFSYHNFTVNVKQLPIVDATVKPSAIVCKGLPISLNGKGATTYSWDNNAINAAYFVPQVTSYKLIGTDSITKCSNTFIQNITINPLPKVDIAVSPASILCSGDSIMLKGSGALRYKWSDNVIDGQYFKSNKSNTYILIATDSNSCNDTSSVEIISKPLPNIQISAFPNTNICIGDSVLLKASGAHSYIWNNSVLNGVAFLPNQTKTYIVYGTDSNNCNNSQSIILSVLPLPKITSQPSNQFVRIGSDAQFSINSSSLLKSYQWQENQRDSFYNLSDNLIYTGAATNILTIKDFEFYQNNFKYRCIISDGVCKSISQSALMSIDSSEINNHINQDGFMVYPNPTSDLLSIQGRNSILGLTFQISDATGRVVYTSTIVEPITVLNIEDLSQGMYTIQFTERHDKVYKILKL